MFDVHFSPGDGAGWALDEDLRQMRLALDGVVRERSAAAARILHAPFWQNLSMIHPRIVRDRFVIAHADNPPFFYLKQPEFALGQRQVDLWVARSREACAQFETLRMPVVHIPYTIDPDLFFSILEKTRLREEFGIPADRYVIANFHRDTEGADLRTPKTQKQPELFVDIVSRLVREGLPVHVLLAGPRRHWISSALEREGIPFTFIGKPHGGRDDFGLNILDRRTLNKLYNASDLYLIPSRWEGGPQSAMEAAACRCKVLSTRVGVSLDLLEPQCLFETPSEAVGRIARDIRDGVLDATIEPQHARWKKNHTTRAMADGLRDLYARLPEHPVFRSKLSRSRSVTADSLLQIAHTLRRRFAKPAVHHMVWLHQPGSDEVLDVIIDRIRQELPETGSKPSAESFICMVGTAREEPPAGACAVFQWVSPNTSCESVIAGAVLLAPSVQDVANLRAEGVENPAVVVPVVPGGPSGESGAVAVVPVDDLRASWRVWQALAAGRTVLYPRSSCYFEQVFHAGRPYEGDQPALAEEDSDDLARFAFVPSPAASARALQRLASLIQ